MFWRYSMQKWFSVCGLGPYRVLKGTPGEETKCSLHIHFVWLTHRILRRWFDEFTDVGIESAYRAHSDKNLL